MVSDRLRARRLGRPLSVVTVTVLGLLLAVSAPAAAADPSPVYAYGHSWTQGAGVSATEKYTHLISAERNAALVSRGVSGSLVHRAAERVLAKGSASWRAGTRGDVVIQANLNTARDYGVDKLALATSRNSLRTMLATITASRRIEEGDRAQTYSAGWKRKRMAPASGGTVRTTNRRGAYVQFRAAGNEYVVIRGVVGAGTTIKVEDRTKKRTLFRVKTGAAVKQRYSRYGVPLVFRLPTSANRHVIRLTKEKSAGSFTFDARLPRGTSARPIMVLEPYLADYSLSTTFRRGSDAAIDAFNRVARAAADEFSSTVVVDPNRYAWKPLLFLQEDGVHPNPAGNRFLADLIERLAWGFVRPSPTPEPTPTPAPEPEPGPEPRQPDPPLPALGDGQPVPPGPGPAAP